VGKIGDPQSRVSKAPVPMCAVLAEFMMAWHRETPYAQPQDFVFFSEKLSGKKPRTGNMVSQDFSLLIRDRQTNHGCESRVESNFR